MNLYEKKIKKFSDKDLLSECLVHLRALEAGLLTKDHIYRANKLFNEAVSRRSLEWIKYDFMAALRILKFIQGNDSNIRLSSWNAPD